MRPKLFSNQGIYVLSRDVEGGEWDPHMSYRCATGEAFLSGRRCGSK